MQEQTGMYGALILVPRDKEPYGYDRDYVIMLSDWTDEAPMTIVSNLKQQSDYYNFQGRTLGTFIEDAKKVGFTAAVQDRLMWGQMRMSPTDIQDVTGSTYTYLINGKPSAAKIDAKDWGSSMRPARNSTRPVRSAIGRSGIRTRLNPFRFLMENHDGEHS
jgi:hypothetical protein